MTEPRNPAPPDDSAYGVLRIKAGPGGGAVRLATLVRDLMERHQMARAEAVRAHLLPPLSEPNAPALYLLQPGGNAQPLGEREWFGTPDGNPGKKPQAGRVVRSRGIGYAPTNIPMADSVGRGLVGALAWLNRVWGNPAYADAVCMDALDLSAVASRLAVSELDAAEVWGWGSAAAHADDAGPVADAWDGARLLARRDALRASGVRAYMQALAGESGIKERDIRRMIEAAIKARKPQTASVFHYAVTQKRAGRAPD